MTTTPMTLQDLKDTERDGYRFTFHDDPSHGWLAVPARIVQALGIIVTPCSYHDATRDLVYLEEDCDASAFYFAWTAAGLKPYELGERSYPTAEAPLRRLPPYRDARYNQATYFDYFRAMVKAYDAKNDAARTFP